MVLTKYIADENYTEMYGDMSYDMEFEFAFHELVEKGILDEIMDVLKNKYGYQDIDLTKMLFYPETDLAVRTVNDRIVKELRAIDDRSEDRELHERIDYLFNLYKDGLDERECALKEGTYRNPIYYECVRDQLELEMRIKGLDVAFTYNRVNGIENDKELIREWDELVEKQYQEEMLEC